MKPDLRQDEEISGTDTGPIWFVIVLAIGALIVQIAFQLFVFG